MENNLSVTNWESFKEQASMLVKSGFLPTSINTPEKALAIAMTSKELGIPMMEGFRSINVIQGKPCVSPQLMLALANRTGQVQDIQYDSNDERCRVTITRKGRTPHTEEFGRKEATDLGLIGRDNYKKQFQIMARWRALAAALRVVFPDVVLGLYSPEEMGAEVKTNLEGDMEIVDDQMVNTGVRQPTGYSKMTPEEKQARIGEGNEVRNTPEGPFIFTNKQSVDEFQASVTQKPEITQENALQEAVEALGEELIDHAGRIEIFRLAKERGLTQPGLKKFLKDEFGLSGTSVITNAMYPKVIKALEKFESSAVGK